MKPVEMIKVTCSSCKTFVNTPKSNASTVRFCYACGKFIQGIRVGDEPFISNREECQQMLKDLQSENIKELAVLEDKQWYQKLKTLKF